MKAVFYEVLLKIGDDYTVGELKSGDLAGPRENFYKELKRASTGKAAFIPPEIAEFLSAEKENA